MKRILILFLVITSIGLQSCEKELSGDNYDFSKSLAPYVELTTKSTSPTSNRIAVNEGANATFPVRLRTALQEPITVNYEITGAFTRTGTATIPRNTTTANIVVAIPTAVVPVGQTTVDAVLTLKSAMMGSESLTIGYPNSVNEKRNIRISRP